MTRRALTFIAKMVVGTLAILITAVLIGLALSWLSTPRAAHQTASPAVHRSGAVEKSAGSVDMADARLGAPKDAGRRATAMPDADPMGDPLGVGAPFIALDQEAGDTKAGGAGATDSPVSGLASSADLDLADFASLPPLRPLASDCRLPCYGTPRVGPASWYYDGPGWYAAIPGYLGGVVSVVVCTFPDGRANCHTFPVRDSCQCYRHTPAEIVVDLSPAAFVEFQPDLRRGIVMVQITVLR